MIKRFLHWINPPYVAPHIEPGTYDNDKLPQTASQLIYLALHDLEAIEAKSDLYTINMYVWHKHSKIDDTCYVCLGGSIMANTIKIDRGYHIHGCHIHGGHALYQTIVINHQWKPLLLALNELRQGYIESAGSEWTPCRLITRYRRIVSYSDNPTKFKKQMLKLARDYERAEALDNEPA